MSANKHKYERLYRLAPRLYDTAYIIKNRAFNVVYIVKYRGYLFKQLDSVYKAECEVILNRIGKYRTTSTMISPSAAVYLYSLVRELKPEIFLETGVSQGLSSLLILEAMEKNGNGTLFSTDISNDVGKLVPSRLYKRWRRVIDVPEIVLKKAIELIGDRHIDIFMHDSDHTYDAMINEFRAVKDIMSKNGIILSDDVEENKAFVDFASSVGTKPKIIASYKCFGIIELGKRR